MLDAEPPRKDDIAYLAALLREVDLPRYYATLFAPEPLRSDLFALYGFAAEIERIPNQVRDPMLGCIRQQWWLDRLEEGAEGAADAPALRALLSVAERHALPAEVLRALIEGHAAQVEAARPLTIRETEELLAKTQSGLFRLGSLILGADFPHLEKAAYHAGVAYGLARRLTDLGGEHNPDAACAEAARKHLRAARDHLREPKVPWQSLPVFLPLVAVEPMLARAAQTPPGNRARTAALSDLRMLLRMSWARLRRQI